jgi:tyrosyl-tRNA synthetase
LFEPEEIVALERSIAERPELRQAQRALALDLTTRVHGADEAARAVAASEAAFSGSPIVDPAVLATLHRAADGFTYAAADVAEGPIGFLVASGTSSSKSEARRSIAGGAITINDHRVSEADSALPEPIAGEWYVVRIGKRRVRVGRRAG